MRFKVIAVLGTLVGLTGSPPSAHAGAIRFAGKQLHKGSIAAVQKTSDAKGTAMADAEDAGRAARAALKNRTQAMRKNTASAPGAAVKETKSAASKIWTALW